ncbi:hypothetical protein SNE40_022030 [Patella caerulea]|uniref:Uncharacterized protein n=1 Tax=Patella caerulea TaxID=87958 RepID=A0AAN8G0U1_PATCE
MFWEKGNQPKRMADLKKRGEGRVDLNKFFKTATSEKAEITTIPPPRENLINVAVSAVLSQNLHDPTITNEAVPEPPAMKAMFAHFPK